MNVSYGDAVADAAAYSGDPAADAANSTASWTSVTQSSNADSAGVTSDRANATFTNQGGPRLVVEVTREGKDALRLDSATDFFEGSPFAESAGSPVHGVSFATGVLYRETNTEFTVAGVSVDWDSTDATDFLAGGYWLHATYDTEADRVDSVEIGAFSDGPEISATPDLPVTGTATYRGLADGLYTARVGTDSDEFAEGSHQLGTFVGDIGLAADFGARSISGRVDNISVYFFSVPPDYNGEDELEAYSEEPSSYVLDLGMASFDSDGNFVGTGVSLTHPGVDFTTTGSWGGRFSTEDDGDGNPRLVAGTLGGSAATPGETTTSFVGKFLGTTTSNYHE